MAGDLYERLKRIRSGAKPGGAKPGGAKGGRCAPDDDGAAERLDFLGLDEWTPVAPLVFERETSETLPPRVTEALGEACATDAVTANGRLESRVLGREVDAASLAFMDTETTGLSGGAGTTVFLVGAGRIDGDRVRVRQVLLADFPGEPSFLERAAQALAGEVWVSYNGKAFDARLLESRFLMNGIPPLASEQLDLLPWSRRLWRRSLGSCSLGDIEAAVLDRGRTDDVPGIEIPDRYFRFLRHRDAAELGGVFEHHRLDIVSLVHLFAHLEEVLRRPLAQPRLDEYQLGRWLLLSDEPAALELLGRAAADVDPEYAVRAAMLLARVHRRGGAGEEALRVLEPVANGSLGVVEQIAKIHEHDRRDPAAALAALEAYFAGDPDAASLPVVAHRVRRLREKIRRRRAGEARGAPPSPTPGNRDDDYGAGERSG
ncbi:MAG: ribonuclease H-like domain-containing protein [Spirochaetota bacterium]